MTLKDLKMTTEELKVHQKPRIGYFFLMHELNYTSIMSLMRLLKLRIEM